jgi:TonB-dependent starch-binding outer membrane protein SusC
MQFNALCSALALPVLKQGSLTKTITAHKQAVRKMLLIMKLTAILLLVTCMHVSAGGYAQPVTIYAWKAPIEKVFSEIKKQTGYTFAYTDAMLKKAHPVTINIANGTVEQALDICFRNQPVTYTIINKTVVVKPAGNITVDEAVEKPAPDGDIRGFVSGDNNTPVSGASVMIKRTGRGTTTKENGEFKLSEVKQDDILLIGAMGYERKEVAVKDYKNGFVVVQLKISPDKLDEVQVLAYGQTTTRRLNTGSVSRVTGEEIARQPVTNVLQALVGRTAGMSITQASGIAGSEVTFQIRGQNSVNSDPYTSAPLVIVDGVPYPSTPITHKEVSGVDNYGGAGNNVYVSQSPVGYGNNLYNLNPSDIESVEILKDADATAIYGSRAGNGVMLITTKKGKQGKTRVDVNVNSGMAINTRRVDLLTTPEYLALRREGFRNAGITPTAANAPDLFLPDSTTTHNWQDKFLGNTANIIDVNMSMSGGAGGTSFLISGNYHHENTVYPDRRGSQKAGAHYSMNHSGASGKFNIGLSGMVNVADTKLPQGNYGSVAYSLPPDFQAFDSAGNLKWDWGGNPYSAMRTSYSNKTFSLTSNLSLRYTILPGLDAKAAIGYTRIETDQQIITPKAAANPANTFFQSSNALSNNRFQTLNFEPQVQYVRLLAEGTLNVMAGATIMKNIGEMFSVGAYNFSSDAYINNIALASRITNSTTYNAYQYASFFGRINYNWLNRYIVNGSFRRDGSSKFGPGHRYGNFGAIGGAWLFSNEAFAKNNSWLSYGKLRGSIGWVGSDNTGGYGYLPLYAATTYPYNSTAGVVPSILENPDYGWESSTKLEGALELGFLKNRVLLTTAWYRNRTGNQLVTYPVSTQTGFESYTANLSSAIVQNTGWEFELTTVNVSNKNFKWTTSFNLTLPDNKLLKFDGLEKTPYASGMFQVGKSLAPNFAIPFLGLDAAGKPQYEDVNKNGQIDFFRGPAVNGRGDKVYIGKSFAGYYGGLSNTISYGNLQLDFTLQYTGDQQKVNYLGYVTQPGQMANLPRKAVNDIRAQGLDKAFVNAGFSIDYFNYIYNSSAIYMNADFIRLTNAALSYNFSEKLLKPWRLVGLRTYVQAQNLFVISNYDGFDPESGPVAVPPLFRITAGIKCTF